MPKSGIFLAMISRVALMAYVQGAGSPGPLERKTPSGFMASTSSTGVCAGTTVTRMPRSTSMRRMLVFTPKS